MNRQERFGPRQQRIAAIQRLEVQRQECRVPVIAMKYIRAESQAPAALERRAGKQQEAAMLIGIGGI